MGRAPNAHSPRLKSAEKPEDGRYHEAHGSMWEVTASSWVLLHLPANGEDHAERRLGSDPRIWGLTHSDKPLQSAGHCMERPRRASIAVSLAAGGEDKTGGNTTGKQREHSQTGLSPLLHGLHAHATFLIPRDLPLLALPLLCPLPPLLFPPRRTGPARSRSRV